MKSAIIVADDSALIRNIISKKLSNEYIVLQASNGKEVVRLITQNTQFNIIGLILDLVMPEYDGFYVLDYYKQNNLFNKIPVAIISGDDSKATIDKTFKYPIVDMLNKPLSNENIKSIVEKMKIR